MIEQSCLPALTEPTQRCDNSVDNATRLIRPLKLDCRDVDGRSAIATMAIRHSIAVSNTPIAPPTLRLASTLRCQWHNPRIESASLATATVESPCVNASYSAVISSMEHTDRPAVRDDVMHGQHQEMPLFAQLQQGDTDQRVCGQVKRACILLALSPSLPAPVPPPAQASADRSRQRTHVLVDDHCASACPSISTNVGSQRFMTSHDFIQTLLPKPP